MQQACMHRSQQLAILLHLISHSSTVRVLHLVKVTKFGCIDRQTLNAHICFQLQQVSSLKSSWLDPYKTSLVLQARQRRKDDDPDFELPDKRPKQR